MSIKIKKLKEQWDNYNKSWNGEEEYEKFNKEWTKDRINSLKLEEYTNIDPSKNEYFTNWIERKTENCGKFRTASSFAYGVYKVNHSNIDEKKYKEEKEFAKDKYRTIIQKNNSVESYKNKYIQKEEAKNYFEENIKKHLVDLVNFTDIKDLRPLNINFARKVAYMYNIDKLIPIYKKEVIESIAEFFGVKKVDFSSYKATQSILEKLKEEFGIDSEIDIELSQKIASFLWDNFGKSVNFDSKNIIYYGAPGTGKTYTVQNSVRQRVLQSGDDLDDVALFTQFHPSFGYEDFIEGLKPHIKNGATELKLTNGIFKNFCKKAMNNLREHRENPKENKLKEYYFVADEINRAELSTVFGELLLCLEENKRVDFVENGSLKDESMMIETQYSYLYSNEDDRILGNSNKFGVPANLYFIGTMNDIDRSIDSFDLALRRRFIWERMDCDYEIVVNSEIFKDIDDLEPYINICKGINSFISKKLELGKSYEVGHAYFMDIHINQKTITKKSVQELFDKKLKPLIEEYLRGEYSQVEIEVKLKEANEIFSL